MKTLGNAKMFSLKDKLNELASKEVPTDVPVKEAKEKEIKDTKKELKKAKGGN